MCGIDEKCQVRIRNFSGYTWKTYLKRANLLCKQHDQVSLRWYIYIFLQYCVD